MKRSGSSIIVGEAVRWGVKMTKKCHVVYERSLRLTIGLKFTLFCYRAPTVNRFTSLTQIKKSFCNYNNPNQVIRLWKSNDHSMCENERNEAFPFSIESIKETIKFPFTIDTQELHKSTASAL